VVGAGAGAGTDIGGVGTAAGVGTDIGGVGTAAGRVGKQLTPLIFVRL
jgi:hypothetical protein